MGDAVTSFGVLLAVAGIYFSARFALYTKLADVIVSCNQRYDELIRQRTDLEILFSRLPAEPAAEVRLAQRQATIYFNRYWGLKSDQFDYWLAGFVDPETLSTWFASSLRAFAEPAPEMGGISFADRWIEVKRWLAGSDPVFVRLVDQVAFIAKATVPSAPLVPDNSRFLALVALFEDTEREQLPFIRFQFGGRLLVGMFRLHHFGAFRKMLEHEAGDQDPGHLAQARLITAARQAAFPPI